MLWLRAEMHLGVFTRVPESLNQTFTRHNVHPFYETGRGRVLS